MIYLRMARSTDMTALLKKSTLRRTPARTGVLDLLARSDRPLSVPEIVGKLKGLDTVTTYRTLNTFVRKGLVHRVRGADRSWLYAAGSVDPSTAHRHPHFVCDECGSVQCLQDSVIPTSFVASLGIPRAYRVTFAEVVLHGTCPRCAPG